MQLSLACRNASDIDRRRDPDELPGRQGPQQRACPRARSRGRRRGRASWSSCPRSSTSWATRRTTSRTPSRLRRADDRRRRADCRRTENRHRCRLDRREDRRPGEARQHICAHRTQRFIKATYRKIHMFDVVVNGQEYKESDHEDPGNESCHDGARRRTAARSDCLLRHPLPGAVPDPRRPRRSDRDRPGGLHLTRPARPTGNSCCGREPSRTTSS